MLAFQRPGRSLPQAAAFALVVLGSTVAASAISFDATGKVNGWNITPFGQANGNTVANGITSIRQNNYSPINYPGIGNIPSPGGTTGEKFDLEELHIRNSGSQVQVLLIASSLFQATGSGATLNLGDLLINTDGDAAFELGVVTQSGNAGLNAGRLYEVGSTAGLQNLPGSYHGTAIASEIGPWAVASGIGHNQFAIETASFNFGGSEGVTYAYQYTFDLAFLPSLPSHLEFQMSWGCGNDVIEGGFDMTTPPPPTISTTTAVPEPTPAILLIVVGGVAGTMLGRRRVQRAAVIR